MRHASFRFPAVSSLIGVMPYLQAQRWFNKNHGQARSIEVSALAPVAEHVAWAQLVMRQPEGVALYQLPLCICAAEEVPDTAVICRHVQGAPSGHVLADAVWHGPSRTHLLAAMEAGGEWSSPQGRWTAIPRLHAPSARSQTSHPIAGEQSNSSVVFDDAVILKLFRRLHAGPNPDIEIGIQLTAAPRFQHFPAVHATLQFTAADGQRYDAAMAQQFVANSQDGWRYVLAEFARDPTATATLPAIRGLGVTTAELHATLAAIDHPDFAPVPTTQDTVRTWREAALSQARLTHERLTAAMHQDALPPAAAMLAAQILATPGLLERAIGRAADAAAQSHGDAGMCLRQHGDYHLGQVLRTGAGDWYILDFEGEPLRPLALRRQRHSPLRDVAGMLRSFAYAAGHAAMHPLQPGAAQAAATAAEAWHHQADAAFWQGYLSGPSAALLPQRSAVITALTQLFLLDKAIYELAYELAYRPNWATIPLTALVRLCRQASEPPA